LNGDDPLRFGPDDRVAMTDRESQLLALGVSQCRNPPQRVGVTEFDSVEKAQAWVNSSARKELGPVREKAVKIVRQYILEGK